MAEGNAKEAVAVVAEIVDEGERLTSRCSCRQPVAKAEAEEALRAQIARWTDTGAFYIAQTTGIAAMTISPSNGLSARTSRRILALLRLSARSVQEHGQ